MRLAVEYLVRAREDLEMVLEREPRAAAIIYESCGQALRYVLVAIRRLESASQRRNGSSGEAKLKNLRDTCRTSRVYYNELCEWLAGRNQSDRIARQILCMISSDLQRVEGCARPAIARALQHISVAIDGLSDEVRDES